MSALYRHTQIGYLILGVFTATGMAAFVILPATGGALLLMILLLVPIAAMFSALTVSVTEEWLILEFGAGFPVKRIRTGEIESVESVRNPWYYGWGIRLTPRGWLWNVSGTAGVELTLRSGRRFCVGTDEPEKLVHALRKVVS